LLFANERAHVFHQPSTQHPLLAPITNQRTMSPSLGIAPLHNLHFFFGTRLPNNQPTSIVLVRQTLHPTISQTWTMCLCLGALLRLPLNCSRMFWWQSANMILLRGTCRVPASELGRVSLPWTVFNRRHLSPHLLGLTNRSRVLALNHCSKESRSIIHNESHCHSRPHVTFHFLQHLLLCDHSRHHLRRLFLTHTVI
jgi:hypothetical protein